MPAKTAVRIGGILGIIWAAQIALGYVEGLGLGPLSGGLFAIGIVVFYGWQSCGLPMRATITATFVAVYLGLLAAFLTSERTRQQIESQTGEQVWQGFSWLVGAIVISYFGATVASEAIDAFGTRPAADASPEAAAPEPNVP